MVNEFKWVVGPRGSKPRLTITLMYLTCTLDNAGIVDSVYFDEDGKLAFKTIYVIRLN